MKDRIGEILRSLDQAFRIMKEMHPCTARDIRLLLDISDILVHIQIQTEMLKAEMLIEEAKDEDQRDGRSL